MSEHLEPRNWDLTRAYVLLRVTLRLTICLHGVVRWIKSLNSFAESLVPLFAKTLLPPWSVFDFGYVIPILEALMGAAVLFGPQTRRALQKGSALMLALMFGSSLREYWPRGFQLQSLSFVVAMAFLLFFMGPSMPGMFDLGLTLTGAGDSLTRKDGYTGSFFIGVLATVVATPYTAPLWGRRSASLSLRARL